METEDQESSEGNTLAQQTAGQYQGYNEEEEAARAGPSGLATNQPTTSRAPEETMCQTCGSSSESQEGEVFRCDICAKEFLSARGLQLHRQADHENVRFKCTECGQIFKRRSDLLAHLKNHLGMLHQTCSDCGLVFKRPSTLGQHYNRVHLHMVTYHFCSKCGKRFESRPSMRRHEKDCNNE
ncbi:gastrula zinc finger protein XlCGF42.1-like [Thrips palmi]|uniref:Gastrula zinc finger protein XlCGF42.1-like n=1 Tax=Thrips palmi TaxID=161013 RepID=A0A6P8ZMJ9_THRPL|nr:gastrula zinc finger protein XlCGF42.1-like [Thrips palmi]